MNVFGVAPLELLLIMVIALIVFGPARLPEIMGQIGRAVRDFQRATSGLSEEFNRTIQAEIAETRAAVQRPVEEVRAAVDGTRTPPAERPPSSAGHPAPASGNGSAPAQPAPPLASVPWSWETSPAPPERPANAGPPPPTGAAHDDLQPPY